MSGFTPVQEKALLALALEVQQLATEMQEAVGESDFNRTLAAISSLGVSFQSAVFTLRNGGGNATFHC